MLWAAIVALLRDRFNANEILVSLMLVYVADQLLSYMVYGPWKDPAGYNFPQTITFLKSTQMPSAVQRLARQRRRDHRADRAVGAFWVLLFRTYGGLPVAGRRPRACGGALRRLLVAPRAVDRAADVGRHGRPGRRFRDRRAASASSRPMCRPAMASRRSSSRTSGGCIRWASCSRRS